MTRGAVTIQLAHEGLIDTAALGSALHAEQIASAALDVEGPEPIPADWCSEAYDSNKATAEQKTRRPKRFGRTGSLTKIMSAITATGGGPGCGSLRDDRGPQAARLARRNAGGLHDRVRSPAGRTEMRRQKRAHNANAFTAWLAGGGMLAGSGYGTTDEVGFTAVEKPTRCYATCTRQPCTGWASTIRDYVRSQRSRTPPDGHTWSCD
jgi:hypothetical protein